VQVIGAGRDRVKFALDPLAEYLAGLYVVEHYGGNEQLWRDFQPAFMVDDRATTASRIRPVILYIQLSWWPRITS
jgi:hypothetical protein